MKLPIFKVLVKLKIIIIYIIVESCRSLKHVCYIYFKRRIYKIKYFNTNSSHMLPLEFPQITIFTFDDRYFLLVIFGLLNHRNTSLSISQIFESTCSQIQVPAYLYFQLRTHCT